MRKIRRETHRATSGAGRPRWRTLLAIGAVVVAGLLPAGCSPVYAVDVQGVETRDLDSPGTVYYSNRDCGFSARITGVDSRTAGSVTRDLWVFCDSGGFDSAGTPFGGPGFPTNTASLVAPVPGTLPPLPSKVVKDSTGRPLAFARFIIGGNAYPTCGQGEYAAEWVKGVIRLPDGDPRRETVLVFYQNMCVSLSPQSYRFFDGGVARMNWDAETPDIAPTATVLNDRLFVPGRFVNQWWPAGLTRSGVYGSAPYFVPGTGELRVAQCGSASDCTSARWFYDARQPVQANLTSVALRANWSYRADGPSGSHADDVWTALPPADAKPDDDCTPTSFEGCGTAYPPATAVLKADTDPLSQVWAVPSAVNVGSHVIIAYRPGPEPGTGTVNVDHAAVRTDDGNGIFGVPNRAVLPAEHCAPVERKGCYAVVLHPELDHDQWMYFSYRPQNDLTLPNGTVIGSIRIGRACAADFTGGTCS